MKKAKKQFEMPSALVIVMIFLFIVTVLTWFIPTSVVTVDENGNNVIHYNSAFDEDGNIIENAGTDPKGLWDFLMAPINGFTDAADVAGTIFISGGALAILAAVGALDAGINTLLKKYKGNTLIVLLMLVFALMGTVYGSWEELPAYAIIIIPLFVKAGYDVMTGICVVLVGSTIGNMASIVNPYSVGTAVAAIGNEELSLGSGILLRLILFAAMSVVGCGLVLRYAAKVKKDPSASCVANIPNINTRVNEETDADLYEMTPKRKWSLVVFAIMVIACLIGYIPWDSVVFANGKTEFDYVNGFVPALSGTFLGNLLGVKGFNPCGWWYFAEFSWVWLLGAIVIAMINKMPEKKFVTEFGNGAADLINVVFVLSAARGIALLMGSKTEGMSITFIYWIQSILQGVPLWAFALAALGVYLLIGIFLQSTSGVGGITMPIFGSVAMALFATTAAGATGGQIVLISAFTCGIGLMSCIYPGATNMGIIEMANVPYNTFLKQVLKFVLPMLATAAIIITVAPYIGLA